MSDKRRVRCAECGIESEIITHGATIESVGFSQDEMRRNCKLAKDPSFDFNCPHLQGAIRAATLPSGSTK
jgi:hypothetical protein